MGPRLEEGEKKVMSATGRERLYNLISVEWRGVCQCVSTEKRLKCVRDRAESYDVTTNTHTQTTLNYIWNVKERSEEVSW